jgi:hypothetical protein
MGVTVIGSKNDDTGEVQQQFTRLIGHEDVGRKETRVEILTPVS